MCRLSAQRSHVPAVRPADVIRLRPTDPMTSLLRPRSGSDVGPQLPCRDSATATGTVTRMSVSDSKERWA